MKRRYLKLFMLSVLVCILSLVYMIQNSPTKSGDLIHRLAYLEPCGEVITYKLGTVDPKFNLTNGSARTYIEKAVSIWEDTYGKSLFKEDPAGKITINFTYDERQELRTYVEMQKDSVEKFQVDLDARIAAYEKRLDDYKKRAARLNAEIESWNKRGGAPSDIYDKLVSEIKKLNAEAEELNREADKINNESQGLGKTVETLNESVTNYNTLLVTKPEEGIYDPNDNTITVYVIGNEDELVSTLAHEFGHAAGMDHVDGEESIMYVYANTNLKPSSSDINELDKVCQPKSRFEMWKEVISQATRSLQNVI